MKLQPGDLVLVDGCHDNYRPRIVRVYRDSAGIDLAVVETPALGEPSQRTFAVSQLRPAGKPRKRKR